MRVRLIAALCASLAVGAIACGGDDDFDDKLPQGSSPRKTFSGRIEQGGSGEAVAPGDGQQQTGNTSGNTGAPTVTNRPKLQ
jgi:hypothetical protein